MKDTTAQAIDNAGTRHGFLLMSEVEQIAADPATRLMQLLVRCGGCRFLAPAQDVAHLVRCVQAGGDYARDVSLPATGRNHGRGGY